MKVRRLIKMLEKKDPEAKVYIAVEGYHTSAVRVSKAGKTQYSGEKVRYPGSVVLRDDGSVEELGIY